MEASPEAVVKSVESGKPEEMIGSLESGTVDFKAEPYQVATARQKQELAKDVAAFANARGGTIALGFKTMKSGIIAADVVKEPRPFPLEQFQEETWMKLISDWVYPVIEGISCRWYPAPEDDGKGYAVIAIPEQAVTRKPFLVARTAFEENKTEGAIFGLFERRRAGSEPVGVHEVQARMRDGDLLRRVLELRENPSALGQLFSSQPSLEALSPVLSLSERSERIEALIRVAELSETPTYILTAAPTPPTPGQRFFGEHAREVVELLHHPPEIRNMGFDLETGAHPEFVEGRSRRSLTPYYKALELWRDGLLVFAATAGPNFLSWGTREEGSPVQINPLVLSESTFLFAELTERILKLLAPEPPAVQFTLELQRLCVGGKRAVLQAYRLGGRVMPWHIKESPKCDVALAVQASGGFNPAQVAYALRAEVYHWFGLENEHVPYVTNDLPEPATSIEEMKR